MQTKKDILIDLVCKVDMSKLDEFYYDEIVRILIECQE